MFLLWETLRLDGRIEIMKESNEFFFVRPNYAGQERYDLIEWNGKKWKSRMFKKTNYIDKKLIKEFSWYACAPDNIKEMLKEDPACYLEFFS